MIAFVTFSNNVIDIAFYGLAYVLMEDRIQARGYVALAFFKTKGTLCSSMLPKAF